ncbi:MAG: acyl-CoA carboxylase subunit beta [Oscillospiraceae bacterium]|jgi:propionyl-CoA carboxylase beta chain|nr:acyl-CoA carboxylase subunit beta [Oscillospiraceae bacterium]
MEYQITKQHIKKKYHAFERIQMIVDRGSFTEIGSGIANYSTSAHENNEVAEYDGVITGKGKIRGKNIFIFAQDFTVMGGTIGLRHGEKIARTIELAIASQCPVIGIYDSGGARIGEGVNALAGCGKMMHCNTVASGYIPQISIIAGPCAGAAAYSPALTDFVFMIDQVSCMFVTGSDVVKSVTGEPCTNQELGCAEVHNTLSGVAQKQFSTEKDCFRFLRDFVETLPSACNIKPATKYHTYVEKDIAPQENLIPEENHRAYDMKPVLRDILDEGSFLEVGDLFAKSIITGFGKVSGKTIGLIANQPIVTGGVLDCDSSDKAARFVRFCDSFGIPIVTLVDTPGYLPGKGQEHNGILRHGAKLLHAYSEATVPKITVIIRKAFGGAYIAMGSKHLGADFVYSLPNAEIAVMGAEGAVNILYKSEVSKIVDISQRRSMLDQKVSEYKSGYMNPRMAQKEGYIDELIHYHNLRSRIFEDLIILEDKNVATLNKKHGNIPL